MKITALRVTPVAIPLSTPLAHAWGIHPGFGRLIVEVETDEGITGLGECPLSPSRAHEEILKSCIPLLVGEDPFNTELLRARVASPFLQRMLGTPFVLAYAAFEFACLDIQGKSIGRPVYDLLGGKMRDRIPFSAYVFYPAASESFESASDELVSYADQLVREGGYTSFKLKGGVYPPDQEIETFADLRRRFPRLAMRWDPNSVWSVATSVRVARRLPAFDPEYLEDPTWGIPGMARVKRMAPGLPLASNMAVFGYDDVAPGALLEAVDVVLSDPHWYGGIRATRELAKVCETFGLDFGMHSGTEFGISLAAVLHLCASIPSLPHAPDAHYHYLPDDIITRPFIHREGGIDVPTGPGLGVELDRDKLASYHELYEAATSATSAMQAILPSTYPRKAKW